VGAGDGWWCGWWTMAGGAGGEGRPGEHGEGEDRGEGGGFCDVYVFLSLKSYYRQLDILKNF